MIRELILFDEFFDDIHMNQTVLCGISDDIRGVLAFQARLNCVFPKLAHLNHAPI